MRKIAHVPLAVEYADQLSSRPIFRSSQIELAVSFQHALSFSIFLTLSGRRWRSSSMNGLSRRDCHVWRGSPLRNDPTR